MILRKLKIQIFKPKKNYYIIKLESKQKMKYKKELKKN